MSREREIFGEALDITDKVRRDEFLNQQCDGDTELRAKIDELLALHQGSPEFLSEAELAAPKFIDSLIGIAIDSYTVRKRIGDGGCGVVYLAEQSKPIHRTVALKVIKPGLDTDEVIARFEAERQALAMMQHPNVARILDGGATPTGRPYFVMEFVDGEPITDYCDNQRLGTMDRLRLLIDVCQAAQHAHQKGIIHRDLKPSNILVTQIDGQPIPKVIDFGIAKATNQEISERTFFTSHGRIVGTPQYMSPEQAERSSRDIDTRSDVYSLGVVLYELLTGTTPLPIKRLREVGYDEMVRLILSDNPPTPSSRVSALRKQSANTNTELDAKQGIVPRATELDWITMRAMEKDRQRRYQSPAELADDLSNFLQDRPVAARPPSRLYLLSKFMRRHRTGVLVAASFLALLIAGLALTLFQLNKTQKARDYANRLRYDADMDTAIRHWRNGSIGLARQIIEAQTPRSGQPDNRSWEWYFLNHVTRDQSTQKFGRYKRGVWRTSISLDGSTLAISSVDGEVEIWSLRDNRQLETIQLGTLTVSVSLSADGSTVAVADIDGNMRVKAVGDEKWTASTKRPYYVPSIDLSPDGKHLAFVESEESHPAKAGVWTPKENDIRTIDVANGQGGFHSQVAFAANGQHFAIGDNAGIIVVCEATSLRELSKFEAHDGGVCGLSLSADGSRIASSGSNGLITVRTTQTASIVAELKGHRGNVYGLNFLNEGQIVSSGSDGTIRIWKFDDTSSSSDQTQSESRIIGYHADEIWTQSVCAKEGLVLTGSKSGWAKLWATGEADRSNDTVRIRISDDVKHVEFSADSSKLYTINTNGGLQLWNATNGRHERNIRNVGTTADGRGPDCSDLLCFDAGIAIAKRSGRIEVQLENDLDLQIEFDGHLHRTELLGVQNGKLIVSGSDPNGPDDRSEYWDLSTRQKTSSLRLPRRSNYDGGTRLSPDGRWIAVGVPINHISLIDSSSGQEIGKLAYHELSVSGIGFSHDSRMIATASDDGTIRIWESHSGQQIRQMSPGGFQVDVSFSPDGQRLIVAAGSSTDTAMWDVATGRRVATFGVEAQYARFSPDGKSVFVLSRSGTLYLWHVPDGARDHIIEKG